MPTRAPSLALAAACAVAVAACGSYTTYQTAEPLGRGRWQGSFVLGAGGFRDQASGGRTPTAQVELAARRGVTASTDIGLKLYAVGVEASVKHRLAAGRWQWALAGAIGGMRTPRRAGWTDALTVHARATAIATRRTSRRWAWSLGPVVTGSVFYPAGGGHAAGVMAGGFVNVEWSFGGGCWSLVPEVSLHAVVAGDVPVDGGGVALLGLALARKW